MSDTQLIQKVAVIPALDQNGHQVAPGEIITFDPSLSRDPAAFKKSLDKSRAFRDIGKGKSRPVQPDIFPSIAGGPSHTATPPVVPPEDGETGGVPLQTLGLPQSVVEGKAVEEEAPVRTGGFNAAAVIDGNVPTAANRIAEIDNEADLDAVLAAEKEKGNRTGIMEAIEARRAVITNDDD